MMYLLINVVAMSFFLIGLGMLYKKIGVLDFYALETALSQVKDPQSLILPYAFMITAVSLKAALMPLFQLAARGSWYPQCPIEWFLRSYPDYMLKRVSTYFSGCS